jgi:NADH:ubiquinone oxidoreductase subunit 2 (subunit N)
VPLAILGVLMSVDLVYYLRVPVLMYAAPEPSDTARG